MVLEYDYLNEVEYYNKSNEERYLMLLNSFRVMENNIKKKKITKRG